MKFIYLVGYQKEMDSCDSMVVLFAFDSEQKANKKVALLNKNKNPYAPWFFVEMKKID